MLNIFTCLTFSHASHPHMLHIMCFTCSFTSASALSPDSDFSVSLSPPLSSFLVPTLPLLKLEGLKAVTRVKMTTRKARRAVTTVTCCYCGSSNLPLELAPQLPPWWKVFCICMLKTKSDWNHPQTSMPKAQTCEIN